MLASYTPETRSIRSNLPGAHVWLAHWIIFGASCNIAGWLLSAVHQLNPVGLAVAVPAIWFTIGKLAGLPSPSFKKNAFFLRLRKNLRSPLAVGFLILASLSLLGGLLYPPNNLDAFIYRMPRVCDWLMAGHWEWIRTSKNLLNTRGTGVEWWTAPMIALFRTDRLMFAINWISFLFLPGVFFGFFRSLGVRARAARAWMWLMPAGYCYVLQAGSVGNDLPPALFAMAAFDFGFRWRRGGGFRCFALSMLACKMMTAVKGTTLPLLLPFGVVFFGMWRPALANPLRTAALVLCFALSSFLPTAVMNIRYTGDWTGAKAEGIPKVEPLVGIATNTVNFALQNILPPVFPMASSWNAKFLSLFPSSYIERNERCFEEGGAHFVTPDFQGEEQAGLGSGLTLLLAASLLLGVCIKPRQSSLASPGSNRCAGWLLPALLGIAILAYFSRAGLTTVGRLMAPFYPFLFAVALRGRKQDRIVKLKLWQGLAWASLASALLMVVITPSRPLWPSRTMLSRVDASSPKVLQRAKLGYDIYANRSSCLDPVRNILPEDAGMIGYLSLGTSPELPLWKPYMRRRLRHVLPDESLTTLRSEGIRYLVLNTDRFQPPGFATPEDWVAAGGGEIAARIPLQLLARTEPTIWWVVKID